MKKQTISRKIIIAFAYAAKQYVDAAGVLNNKLSVAADKVLNYPPNAEVLQHHDKTVEKLRKKLDRDIRDVSVDHAALVEGVLAKDEKGNLKFTPENQKKVNEKMDLLNDKYESDLDALMLTNIVFYFPEKVKELPLALNPTIRKSLSLLID